MPFPTYEEIEIPLLLNIYNNGGSVTSISCYEPLAQLFNLSNAEISRVLPDGTNRPQWNNMVQWARRSLVNYGYLYNAQGAGKGIWKLTELGIKKAETLVSKRDISYPDDLPETFFEGAVKLVKVNKFERSKTARDKCIDHYGYKCCVCDIDFQKIYGEIGKDFIHVHHITPMSEIAKLYELNPVRDLRPICPNCHSMLHRKTPPLTIEELKVLYKP